MTFRIFYYTRDAKERHVYKQNPSDEKDHGQAKSFIGSSLNVCFLAMEEKENYNKKRRRCLLVCLKMCL